MTFNSSGMNSGVSFIKKIAVSMALILVCVAETGAQEQVEKLPELNRDRVRLIENASFCSSGTGAQGIVFTVEDEAVHSIKTDDYYLPHTDLFDSPFFRIGCTFKKIVIDYSYFESSFRFQEVVVYKEKDYNLIEFQNHNLFIGYSFTIIAHYLYFDLGAGYSHTQYTLDYTADGSLRGSDEEDLSSTNPFIRSSFKFFITDYLYLHWSNQQSPKQTNGTYFSNQLGLSFLVRL